VKTSTPVDTHYRPVKWCMFIDDENLAIMFKLMWP
jgi:hypothetical protein